jgi:hypothetical protein
MGGEGLRPAEEGLPGFLLGLLDCRGGGMSWLAATPWGSGAKFLASLRRVTSLSSVTSSRNWKCWSFVMLSTFRKSVSSFSLSCTPPLQASTPPPSTISLHGLLKPPVNLVTSTDKYLAVDPASSTGKLLASSTGRYFQLFWYYLPVRGVFRRKTSATTTISICKLNNIY